MLYSDILRALPKVVSDSLQQQMDAVQIDPNAAPQAVRTVLQGAVDQTRREILIQDADSRRMVELLLSEVAEAGTKALFA